MIAIPIVQTICFSAYVWYIVYNFKILPSISASWYSEGPTRKKFMFILFIVSISVPTLFLAKISLWFLASAGSLGIVAFAPAFRSEHKIVGILHTGGTVLGIAFACYAMITHGIYFPTIGCMVCSILFERVKMDNTTWWVEVADFAFIELGIFQLITLGI